MKLLSLALFLLIPTFPTWAKSFTNSYCEFELPAGWECVSEGTEWVCQSDNKDRQRESIIILAAKTRGPEDTLDAYTAYLKKQKAFTLPGGKTQVSEAKFVKTSTINTQLWVDSLHLASEVPGFYTRYLATTKEDIGVAVTFSVGKDFYEAYQPLFDKVIASLKVFRQAQAKAGDFKLKNKDENLLDNSTFIPDAMQKHDIAQKKKTGGGLFGNGDTDLILMVIGIAVVIFIFMRIKRKKK